MELLHKANHLVPAQAVTEVDLDTATVYLAVTGEDVTGGPEEDLHTGVDEECVERAEAYYADRLPSDR